MNGANSTGAAAKPSEPPDRCVDIARPLRGALIDHGFYFGGLFAGHVLFDEIVFGGEDDASGPVNRIDASGEDPHFFAGFQREIDFSSFASADPVGLHGEHAVRPTAVQIADVFEQFVGVGGDLDEPLGELFLLDRDVFVTPAAAVNGVAIDSRPGIGTSLWPMP